MVEYITTQERSAADAGAHKPDCNPIRSGYTEGMTVTLEEAQANLPGIVAKAATGEEVFIATGSGRPAVKLVAVAVNGSRLAQDPQVKGALTILNHEALVKPLSPEEWGELAKR